MKKLASFCLLAITVYFAVVYILPIIINILGIAIITAIVGLALLATYLFIVRSRGPEKDI